MLFTRLTMNAKNEHVWNGLVFYGNGDTVYNKEKLARLFGLMRPSDASDFFAGDFSLIN